MHGLDGLDRQRVARVFSNTPCHFALRRAPRVAWSGASPGRSRPNLTANSTDRIEIYNEAMDLSWFGSNDYQPFLRDVLQKKYADKKIDLAIAILSPALDFLLNYGSVIFPGAPIVFCGIDKTELSNRSLPPHVRGIL